MPVSSNEIAQIIGQQQVQFGQTNAYAQQLSQMNPMQSAYVQQQGMLPGSFSQQQMGSLGASSSIMQGGATAAGIGMAGVQIGAAFGFGPRALDPFTMTAKQIGKGWAAGATTGGRMAGALGMGAMSVGAYLAVGKAASWATDNFMQGAQKQIHLSQNIVGNYGASGMQMGQLGAGQAADMAGVATGIADQFQGAGFGNVVNSGTMGNLVGMGMQTGQFQGVKSVAEFSQKLKKLTAQAVVMSKMMKSTVENAAAQMETLNQQYGMDTTQAMKFTSAQLRMGPDAGLSMQSMNMMAQQGSGFISAMGGTRAEGAMWGMQQGAQLGFMRQSGQLSEEYWQTRGGAAGISNMYTQGSMRMLGGKGGRRLLAAMMDQNGELDQDMAQRIASGAASKKEILRRSRATLGTRHGRQQLAMHGTEVAGDFMQDFGQQGVMRGMTAYHGDSENARFKMFQASGMGNQDFAGMERMTRGDGYIRRRLAEAGQRGLGGPGKIGIGQALNNAIDKMLAPMEKALQDAGASMQKGITEWTDSVARDITGAPKPMTAAENRFARSGQNWATNQAKGLFGVNRGLYSGSALPEYSNFALDSNAMAQAGQGWQPAPAETTVGSIVRGLMPRGIAAATQTGNPMGDPLTASFWMPQGMGTMAAMATGGGLWGGQSAQGTPGFYGAQAGQFGGGISSMSKLHAYGLAHRATGGFGAARAGTAAMASWATGGGGGGRLAFGRSALAFGEKGLLGGIGEGLGTLGRGMTAPVTESIAARGFRASLTGVGWKAGGKGLAGGALRLGGAALRGVGAIARIGTGPVGWGLMAAEAAYNLPGWMGATKIEGGMGGRFAQATEGMYSMGLLSQGAAARLNTAGDIDPGYVPIEGTSRGEGWWASTSGGIAAGLDPNTTVADRVDVTALMVNPEVAMKEAAAVNTRVNQSITGDKSKLQALRDEGMDDVEIAKKHPEALPDWEYESAKGNVQSEDQWNRRVQSAISNAQDDLATAFLGDTDLEDDTQVSMKRRLKRYTKSFKDAGLMDKLGTSKGDPQAELERTIALIEKGSGGRDLVGVKSSDLSKWRSSRGFMEIQPNASDDKIREATIGNISHGLAISLDARGKRKGKQLQQDILKGRDAWISKHRKELKEEGFFNTSWQAYNPNLHSRAGFAGHAPGILEEGMEKGFIERRDVYKDHRDVDRQGRITKKRTFEGVSFHKVGLHGGGRGYTLDGPDGDPTTAGAKNLAAKLLEGTQAEGNLTARTMAGLLYGTEATKEEYGAVMGTGGKLTFGKTPEKLDFKAGWIYDAMASNLEEGQFSAIKQGNASDETMAIASQHVFNAAKNQMEGVDNATLITILGDTIGYKKSGKDLTSDMRSALGGAAYSISAATRQKSRKEALQNNMKGFNEWEDANPGSTVSSVFFAGFAGQSAQVAGGIDGLMGLLNNQANEGALNSGEIEEKYDAIMADFDGLSPEEQWKTIEAGESMAMRTGQPNAGYLFSKMRGKAAFKKYRGKDIALVSRAGEKGGYDARIRMMHSAMGGGRGLRDAMGLSGDKERNKGYKQYFRETGRMHPAQLAGIRGAATRQMGDASISNAESKGQRITDVLHGTYFSNDAEVQESELNSKEFNEILTIGQDLANADGVSRGNTTEKQYGKALQGLTGMLKEAADAAKDFRDKAKGKE